MTARHIVHFGDLHLRWSEARRDEQLEARALLEHAIADALEYDPVAWVWPGDLNDGPMTISDRNFLADALIHMGEEAPVFIVYGNHDRPHDLDVFRRLRAPCPIIVASLPQVETVDGVSVAMLPYPTKGSMVAAGWTREDVAAGGGHALETIVDGLVLQLADAPGEIKILAGHINVAGSIASTGQPQIGRELEIPPAVLERVPEGIPVALNHIHKGQAIGRATYAGSMSRLSWGETERKRFLVYRYTFTRGALEPSVEVVEHSIDCPPMVHVDAMIRPGGVVEFPGDMVAIAPGCDVRVRFDYPANDPGERDKAEAAIRAGFDDARRLVVEPHAVPVGDIRAPEVVAATTLEAKVAAFLGDDVPLGPTEPGAPSHAGVLEKLALVQQLDETGVLEATRRALDGDPNHETT